MSTTETLGQRIQRIRAAAGLTQAQVATNSGLPLSSLQNWEIDRREPGFRAACKLAKALGVTAEDLADTAEMSSGNKASRSAGPTKSRKPAPAEPPPPKKPRGRPKKGG